MSAEKLQNDGGANETLRYKRVVVKVGTDVLTENGGIDKRVMQSLVDQIAKLYGQDVLITLVSSGAVGTGRAVFTQMGRLVPDKKATTINQKQAFASVGQPLLITDYISRFQKKGILAGQVLLTREGLLRIGSYRHSRNTMRAQFEMGIVPIVNENDTTAVREFFTDNDQLAGFVAIQMKADALIILTSVEGVLENYGTEKQKLIRKITLDTVQDAEKHVDHNVSSNGGKGGMSSKFNVAKYLMKRGISVHIANGKDGRAVQKIISGEDIGTEFVSARRNRRL